MSVTQLSSPHGGIFLTAVDVHFDQFDPLWILHHSQYLLIAERVQQAFFDHVMEAERFDPEAYPDVYTVVKDIQLNFLSPVDRPGRVHIALRVDQLRSGGMTTDLNFISPNSAQVYVQVRRTVCKLSGETGKPTAWTERYERRMAAWAEAGKTDSARQISSYKMPRSLRR